MKHTSIKLDTPCEFINITSINPLISKCQIKVCYVSDDPNRNKTVITKEFAKNKLANSLPGSPIVGYFNEAEDDFEEHNRIIKITGGKIEFTDTTVPYGFVDLNAKVWFQKFLDDGIHEREYLMTEGYLWTGQYPEARRIITDGNNQSMEFHPPTVEGFWTKDKSGKPQFFIVNEAIIQKLCILGEENEPCFEGANITKPTMEFSFDEDFKNTMYSMMNELKDILTEGGTKMAENVILDNNQVVEEPAPVVVEEPTPVVVEEPTPDNSFAAADNTDGESGTAEDKCPECGKPKSECKCDEDPEDKKDKYSLEEIPEYIELQTQFAELTEKFNALSATCEEANKTIAQLSEFKANVDRQNKQDMIDSFYMLSDEDKKDVIDNIDSYSLDDIEAKLSIICVRNKVNFNLDDNNSSQEGDPATTFSLTENEAEFTPAWIKSVQSVAKDMN